MVVQIILTPISRVFLEKLTTACHWNISWAILIKSTPLQPTYLWFTLILSSRLCLGPQVASSIQIFWLVCISHSSHILHLPPPLSEQFEVTKKFHFKSKFKKVNKKWHFMHTVSLEAASERVKTDKTDLEQLHEALQLNHELSTWIL